MSYNKHLMNVNQKATSKLQYYNSNVPQFMQQQFSEIFQLSNFTPTANSQKGINSPNQNYDCDGFYKTKSITGEDYSRPKRIIQNNQLKLDKEKNILKEFLKQNKQMQQVNDDYMNNRKIWNKSFDLSQNDQIQNLEQNQKTNVNTIAQGAYSQQSFVDQNNKIINPSFRSTQIIDSNPQKENYNPSEQTAVNTSIEKIKFVQTNQQKIQQIYGNTQLKIYKNNKIYKNQYTQKIQTEVSDYSMREKSTRENTLEIKYVDTNMNSLYTSPNLIVNNYKTPKLDQSFLNQFKQRASSVVVKRQNISQVYGQQKNTSILNKLNQQKIEIQSEIISTQNRNKIERLKTDDFSQSPINNIQDSKLNKKNQNIFPETNTKLLVNLEAYSRKQSLKQKNQSEFQAGKCCNCECKSNSQNSKNHTQLSEEQQIQHNNTQIKDEQLLFKNQFEQIDLQSNQTKLINKEQFENMDQNVLNTYSQYKNNYGRKFKYQQKRSCSQMSHTTNQNQVIYPNQTDSNKHQNMNDLNQKNQCQFPDINQENIQIQLRFQNNSVREQKKQIDLNQSQINKTHSNLLPEDFSDDNEEREGIFSKQIIDIQNQKDIKLLINESNTIQTKEHSQIQNQLQNESNLNVYCETDLSTIQYIEKLKKERETKQDDDKYRFQTDKLKLTERLNEFSIKRQIANANELRELKAKDINKMNNENREMYQGLNDIKIEEISQKCQQIYEECFQYVQYQSQLSNYEDNLNKNNIKTDQDTLNLPRLSPINSNSNNQNIQNNQFEPKCFNKYKSQSPIFQQNTTIQPQLNRNRSISQQQQQHTPKQKQNKLMTMQKYLNDNVSALNKQSNISKIQTEGSYSKELSTQEGSNYIKKERINEVYKQNGPKILNKRLKSLDQNQKKKVQILKNNSRTDENIVNNSALNKQLRQDTNLQMSNSQKTKLNSVVQFKDSQTQIEQSDFNSNYIKIIVDDEPISPIKQKAIQEANQILNSPNHNIKTNLSTPNQNNQEQIYQTPKRAQQTPKHSQQTPKIMNQSPQQITPIKINQISNEFNQIKDLYSTPKQKNLIQSGDCQQNKVKYSPIRGAGDFTLGFDNKINYAQDQDLSPSQPTYYATLLDEKITRKDHQTVLSNIYSKSEQKILPYNQTKFMRDNQQQTQQQVILQNENTNTDQIQQSSLFNPMQYSSEFGQTQKENNAINNKMQNNFSFQYQITEVSNVDDECSEINERNLNKGLNQESKFSFVNENKYTLGSQTSFSQKIHNPIPVSEVQQATKENNISRSPTRLLLSQLEQTHNEQNRIIEVQNTENQQIKTEECTSQLQNRIQQNNDYGEFGNSENNYNSIEQTTEKYKINSEECKKTQNNTNNNKQLIEESQSVIYLQENQKTIESPKKINLRNISKTEIINNQKQNNIPLIISHVQN